MREVNILKSSLFFKIRATAMSLNVPFTRGTHWICSSNICSSGKVLLAGRCGRNNAILEETCCWEKDNSGCLNRFDVYNSCYVLFVRKLPPHPPLKAHTHFSTATPPPSLTRWVPLFYQRNL